MITNVIICRAGQGYAHFGHQAVGMYLYDAERSNETSILMTQKACIDRSVASEAVQLLRLMDNLLW